MDETGTVDRVLAGLTVGVVAGGVVAVGVVPSWLVWGSWFVGVVVFGVMVPWFAWRFWRQRRALVRAGWERAEQLERERRLVAEQARLRERARIAQDMHDVLGHDLSLIALSAGALKLAPDLGERHRAAAQDIRVRAAGAVDRLGEVIGVLRDEGEDAPTRPADTDLEALVAEAAASGLAVDLRIEGEGDALPSVVERAAHRVVQEALTNVAKHAARTAADVHVAHTATETTVVVTNGSVPAETEARTGRGDRPTGVRTVGAAGPATGGVTTPAPRSGGRGLIGLDERVRLAGGAFTYGPLADGFEVVARLPHRPPAGRPRPLADPPRLREYDRARRRTRRTLVTALTLPLAAGAVLICVLTVWESVSASRAVLEPGDYARLRIGQDHAEVDPFLPDRQTVHRPVSEPGRPSATGPEGRGITCEYYAMTADRFDDRSGDAYRLCFRGGTLVSLDTVTPDAS